MNKFLIKIFKMGIAVLLIAIIGEIGISYFLYKSDYRIYSGYNYIYNDTTYHDLLINGNSRAWVQYSPYILDSLLGVNSYNLGIDGSSINRQMVKYDRFVEGHGIPKYLVQNVDLFTMNISAGFEREQYYPYFFIDKELVELTDRYENYPWAYKYFPLYRYIGFNEIVLKHLRNQEELYKGYRGSPSKYNGTMLKTLTTVEGCYDSIMIVEFKKFLNELTIDGTKVIFVFAPIYHEVLEKCSEREVIYRMYDSIACEFHIPILDYSDIPMCYDTAYFYNATHLNKTGAELFTTKLAHDIDSIGFLK